MLESDSIFEKSNFRTGVINLDFLSFSRVYFQYRNKKQLNLTSLLTFYDIVASTLIQGFKPTQDDKILALS